MNTNYCECGQEAAIHIFTKVCMICGSRKRGSMIKRRPERKQTNNNARFRFSTMAKLHSARKAIEKKDIEVRLSGRVLVVNKSKRVQVENVIETLTGDS